MAKLRYWSKILLEYDTENNKIRIIQSYGQPEAGTGYKKTRKKTKESYSEEGEEEVL